MSRATSAAAVAAKRAEIARHYRVTRSRTPPNLIALRVRELRMTAQRMFGPTIHDVPVGRWLVRMVAVHLARGREPDKRIPSWLSLYAPWFPADEVAVLVKEVTAIDDTGQFVVPLPTADNLGWGLGITIAQRAAWRLTTIGAVDDTPAKRKARRKAKARAREAARRESGGATPRTKSKSRTRPWAALGVSRATWYRDGQPAPPVPSAAVNRETDSCAATLSTAAHENVARERGGRGARPPAQSKQLACKAGREGTRERLRALPKAGPLAAVPGSRVSLAAGYGP